MDSCQRKSSGSSMKNILELARWKQGDQLGDHLVIHKINDEVVTINIKLRGWI